MVADIGCGTGAAEVATVEAGAPFARWYLVDIHRPTVELAHFLVSRAAPRVAGRFEVKLTSSDEIELPEGSVDVMFMINLRLAAPRLVTDPQPSPGWIEHMLRSVHRVLKPGARLHLFEPTNDDNGAPYPLELLTRNYLSHGFKLIKHRDIVMDIPFHHVILAPTRGR